MQYIPSDSSATSTEFLKTKFISCSSHVYCYGLRVLIVTLAIITVQSNLTNSKTGTSKIVCRLICLEIITLNYSQRVMLLRQRKDFSHLSSHLRHKFVLKSSLQVIIKHRSRNSGVSASSSADKFL